MVGTWEKVKTLKRRLTRRKTIATAPEKAEAKRPQTATTKKRDSVSSLSSSEVADSGVDFTGGEQVSPQTARVRRSVVIEADRPRHSSHGLISDVRGRADTSKPLPPLPQPTPELDEIMKQNRWTLRHHENVGHPWTWAADTRRELDISATVSSGPGVRRRDEVHGRRARHDDWVPPVPLEPLRRRRALRRRKTEPNREESESEGVRENDPND